MLFNCKSRKVINKHREVIEPFAGLITVAFIDMENVSMFVKVSYVFVLSAFSEYFSKMVTYLKMF